MKKQKLLILFAFLFLCFVPFAFAQEDTNVQYNLIQPLPGIQSVPDFPSFLYNEETGSGFIPFLLGLAGLFALIQIVRGGISRAVSGGNPSAISDANDMIWQAILGLVLALSAYLILFTINPDLVNLKFKPLNIQIAPPDPNDEFETQNDCAAQCPGGANNCKQARNGNYYCVSRTCEVDSDCPQDQKCQSNAQGIRFCAPKLQICKDTKKSTDCPKGLTCIKFIKYPEPRCTGLPGHL